MPADLLDVITVTEARAALNNPPATTQDESMQAMVTAISRRLDEMCGPIVRRTYTAEEYDGCTTILRLRHGPAATVTTVTEYSGVSPQTLTAETLTVKTAHNYLVDATGLLLRRRSNGWPHLFADRVAATYSGGRVVDTDTVDLKFKRAAQIVFRHMWSAEHGAGNVTFGEFTGGVLATGVPTFDIPNAAKMLLSAELIPPAVW